MKKIVLAGLTVAVVVAGLGVGAWLLLREDEVTDRGTCGGATYEFAAEADDGALEVSFELQSSGPGETWELTLLQDGDLLLDGTRTTDEDGEVDIDAVADEDADEFEVTATPESGEACTATLQR
jgi:hypothetical protein